MQRLIFLLITLSWITLSQPGKAQDNKFPDVWPRNAVKHPVPAGAQYNVPYFTLIYRETFDFNVNNEDKAAGVAYYHKLYKSIQIQQTLNRDTFNSIQFSVGPNEDTRSFNIRKISADSTVVNLARNARAVNNNAGGTTISVEGLEANAGDEIEYELVTKATGYAGVFTMQSEIPCAEALFRLTAPKTMKFTFSSTVPQATPTATEDGNSNVYTYTQENVMPIRNNALYNIKPALARLEFALAEITTGSKTTKINWQDFGKETFIPYAAITKQEARLVEKELSNLPFLQQRIPLPHLLYLLEQYMKTNYQLIPTDPYLNPGDLSAAIRTKRTDKMGMIKLMNAFLYYLNIPTHVLFTSSRDEIPLQKDLVNPELASNVLLYFPTLGQAMAPGEPESRFPCYPANWINLLAVRCHDTLIGDKSEVITDLINTPLPDYTLSNISLDATLTGLNNPSWDVTQSYGGYAAINVKRGFERAGNDEGRRNAAFNSILPLEPAARKVTSYSATNELFTSQPLDKPVVVKSKLNTPTMVENKGAGKNIKVGELLSGSLILNPVMPDDTLPVQLAFPFYFETRLHIDIPEGYKLMNKDDFAANIGDKNENLGMKMRLVQDGNKAHIFVVQYFKLVDYKGADKDLFKKILERVLILKQQELILGK
ncbi:hypothetical protein [Chitinophaga sp. sic0106]|uniref:hypothetical protein n=1 Tax=Chitinophaga sp. sic0106 TaxID=2854785 RepID=UPI001C4567CB|nr:hypothetical protein [Chitinophaga sp. sic0106]MBV7531139.1 hypothetical protein [Chitinophaga sp. sic0106]